jgi:hypothetical protein
MPRDVSRLDDAATLNALQQLKASDGFVDDEAKNTFLTLHQSMRNDVDVDSVLEVRIMFLFSKSHSNVLYVTF